MELGQVTYFDYEHCRNFLEERARVLHETAQGLEALALFRELFYSFSYEALEHKSLTIGQFDAGVVFLFIPANADVDEERQQHRVARAKALELLGCPSKEPPLVFELTASQTMVPPVGERGRFERWMRSEFLQELIIPKRVQIHLYFNGGAFFRETLIPQLQQRGFEPADDYIQSAKTGDLRVRHPAAPGKLFRIPWVLWAREMLGGGYSVVYIMACLANCLQKLEAAVAPKS